MAQVKHVSRLFLSELERLTVEMEGIGHSRGKCGLLIVMRRGGRGCKTPRLVCMTEGVWRTLHGTLGGVEKALFRDLLSPAPEERHDAGAASVERWLEIRDICRQ